MPTAQPSAVPCAVCRFQLEAMGDEAARLAAIRAVRMNVPSQGDSRHEQRENNQPGGAPPRPMMMADVEMFWRTRW